MLGRHHGGIGLAVEGERNETVAGRAGLVGERPTVLRTVGSEWLCRRRLIAVAFEAALAAGAVVARAVLEEDPVFPAVAVEAQGQRVGSAPTARALVEEAEEHSATPVIAPDAEF